MGEGTNQDDTEEAWLVVHRDVNHPSRREELTVKVAYSIEADKDGRSIVPLRRSPLTAFFPTARETGLYFLIHGPFASTPARDNIESDSPWNGRLLKELPTLVSDSLSVCRRHGFLTPQFLTVLPRSTRRPSLKSRHFAPSIRLFSKLSRPIPNTTSRRWPHEGGPSGLGPLAGTAGSTVSRAPGGATRHFRSNQALG